jgi:alpha-glucuronidase|tara:strand:+ start:1384 stop:1698 length:315 start_codon:yes stop_codon:yes gene_type:complete
MSRDITEQIDDICMENYGHKNWVILSTLSDQEKVGIDTVADIETINGVQVAFFYEQKFSQDDLNIIDNLISSLYDDYEQEQAHAQEVIQAWIRIKDKLNSESKE